MTTPSITSLLHARRTTRSTRSERDDPFHLALVIEGGGMRGIVGVSMAAELQREGFLNAIDSVHGSSAGACAAAYFASGQSDDGVRIYLEDINNRRFIDPWRVLRGKPILDKDFLVDEVMQYIKPLQVSGILSSPGLLNVVVTEVKSGKPIFYDRYRDAAHLYNVIRGSICLPIIAGHSVKLDGVSVFDGGLTQQIAIDSALRQGATHVLVLVTRKAGEMERPAAGGFQADLFALGAVYGKGAHASYKVRNARINAVLERVNMPVNDGVHYSIVSRKANDTEVGRLTTDTQLLKAADRESREAMQRYLANVR